MPQPSPCPRWMVIPERGLYTGIAVFGSIGSGKTLGLILPAMRQLFAYCASDPARKLSGIVLEVKGDLCRQLQTILKSCGRAEDYVEVSLDGNIRYNPLNKRLMDPVVSTSAMPPFVGDYQVHNGPYQSVYRPPGVAR
jgi:superfamily II DNA/RNA helicase